MKKLHFTLALVVLCSLLSGCAAALVGGGAAGGYYFGQNYEVEKKSN